MPLTTKGQTALNALIRKKEAERAVKEAKNEEEARAWAEQRADELVSKLAKGDFNFGDNCAIMPLNGSMMDEQDQLKLKYLEEELGINLSSALERDSMDQNTHYMGIIYEDLFKLLLNS